jgi:hypothetical protein
MAEDYTTVRIKKTTREIIRAAESKYEKAPAEALEILLQPVNDNTKQILLTMEIPRFNEITEMMKILYDMKLIPLPTHECAVSFAIDTAMNGLRKQLTMPMETQSGTKAFM